MSVDLQPCQPPGQRLSRYLSVRNAAANPDHSTSSSVPLDVNSATPNISSLARSMSRYRRTRPVNTPGQLKSSPMQSPHENANTTPSTRPRPRQTSSADAHDPFRDDPFRETIKTRDRQPSTPREHYADGGTPRSRTKRHSGSADRRPRREIPQTGAIGSPVSRQTSQDTAGSPRSQEQARDIGLQTMSAEQNELAQQKQEELLAQEQAERWKRIKREELERLEKELAAAKLRAAPPKTSSTKDRFGFITRRWGDKAPDQVTATNAEGTRFWRRKETPSAELHPVSGPAADAPVSAVNAGERKVLIKYNKSTITLPITPTTTASDLLHSAANELGQGIRPEAFVLLEAFAQLGLERPVRKYEPIRHILNSWAYDTQNALLLIPSATGGFDDDLEVKSVPKHDPADHSAYLYYSQKPGKWEKRWITLRSDGQLMASKRDGVKETTNICHLSDFDIFSPTPRQLSKKIKPPKKVCFAIKSQQKASMFLTTVNFVHFFATNDRKLAASWYKAVQSWRSWYLVNVMGEGHKKPSEAEPATTRIHSAGSGSSPNPYPAPQPRHGRNSSTSSKPYHTSSGKPFISTERYEHITEPISPPPSNLQTKEIHARNLSSRQKSAPPVSFPKGLVSDIPDALPSPSRNHSPPHTNSPHNSEHRPFAPAGLLGNTYTDRQKAQQARDSDPSPPNTATQPDPHLHSTSLGRSTSVRSTKAGANLQHHSSTRQKPKPLVDLSPEYREPPQHVKKGRGIIPSTLPPGGLVDIATSPEIAIEVPSATTWRRPGTSNGSPATPTGEGNNARPTTRHGRTGSTSRTTGASQNTNENFSHSTRPTTAGQSVADTAGFRRMGTLKSTSSRPQTAVVSRHGSSGADDDDDDEALIHLLARKGTGMGTRMGAGGGAVRA